jgi:hypothetical protein
MVGVLRTSETGYCLEKVASQSIPTSNQIISWLNEMESLRKLLPEVSGLPLIWEIESQ